MTLKGKVAFISGGGRGLGRSIALAMAREGASVVIMSRTAEHLREVVSLIRGSGGEGDFCEGDVSEPEDVSRGIDKAVRGHGGLDILVNNAAVIGPARFLDDADEAAQDGRDQAHGESKRPNRSPPQGNLGHDFNLPKRIESILK